MEVIVLVMEIEMEMQTTAIMIMPYRVVNSDIQPQRPMYVASERYLKLLSWVDERVFSPSSPSYASLSSFGAEKSGNISLKKHIGMKDVDATCGWPMQIFILPPHKQTGLKNMIPETAMMHYYCLKGCICTDQEKEKLYKNFEKRKLRLSEHEMPSKTSPDIKVLFLGTGASSPFKYRTVSSIHVELEDGSGVLLDAGDGTYSAMVRKMGKNRAEDMLRNLKMICVSHKHADHISGVARFAAVGLWNYRRGSHTHRILLKRQEVMEVDGNSFQTQSGCSWECSVCGKRFSHRSSVELHQKAVHPRSHLTPSEIVTAVSEVARNVREPIRVESCQDQRSDSQSA
eukprot:753007-Hanusia_phi.AAC.6